MNLGALLIQLTQQRGADFLASDPLRFARRYENRDNREIAAFFSALLAYGRASMIGRNLEDLFSRMPQGPAAFVEGFEIERDLERLKGFKHRFNGAFDMAALCLILREMKRHWGSLEGAFLAGDSPENPDIGPALSNFSRIALETDLDGLWGRSDAPQRNYLSYLFPSPQRGSACKRLCMLMRWLIRPDDGIDLGLWPAVDPARLILPLDTHTARISRLVGLSARRSSDWKMAREVTCALRSFDPADPVRFDFALAHLGISQGCRGCAGPACPGCPLLDLCAASKGLP